MNNLLRSSANAAIVSGMYEANTTGGTSAPHITAFFKYVPLFTAANTSIIGAACIHANTQKSKGSTSPPTTRGDCML